MSGETECDLFLYKKNSSRSLFEKMYHGRHSMMKKKFRKISKKFFRNENESIPFEIMVYIQTILISLSETYEELIENITSRSLLFHKNEYFELCNQDLNYLYEFRESKMNYYIVKISLLEKMKFYEECIECLEEGLKKFRNVEVFKNKLKRAIKKKEERKGKYQKYKLQKNSFVRKQLKCFEIPEFLFHGIKDVIKESSSTSRTNEISKLPNDVIQHGIFTFFEDIDYVTFSHVNLRWRNLSVKSFNERFDIDFEKFAKTDDYRKQFIFRESLKYCHYFDQLLTFSLKIFRYFHTGYKPSVLFLPKSDKRHKSSGSGSYYFLGQDVNNESIFHPPLNKETDKDHLRRFYSFCGGININSFNSYAIKMILGLDKNRIFQNNIEEGIDTSSEYFQDIEWFPEICGLEYIVSEKKVLSPFPRLRIHEKGLDHSQIEFVRFTENDDEKKADGVYLLPNRNLTLTNHRSAAVMQDFLVLLRRDGSIVFQVWKNNVGEYYYDEYNDHVEIINVHEFDCFGKFTRYLFNVLCYAVLEVNKKTMKTGKFKELNKMKKK